MSRAKPIPRKEVEEMLERGVQLPAIAKHTGHHIYALYKALRRWGLRTATEQRRGKTQRVDVERLRYLAIEENLTSPQIAKRMHTSPGSIWRVAKREGIKLPILHPRTTFNYVHAAPVVPLAPAPEHPSGAHVVVDLSSIRPAMFGLADYDPVIRRALHSRIAQLKAEQTRQVQG